jgi:hypothetical protein
LFTPAISNPRSIATINAARGAEPSGRRLPVATARRPDGARSPAIARLGRSRNSIKTGRSRSALGAVATFLSLVALRREH